MGIPCLAVDGTEVAGIMEITQEMGPVAPYWNGFGRGAAGEFGNRVMVRVRRQYGQPANGAPVTWGIST